MERKNILEIMDVALVLRPSHFPERNSLEGMLALTRKDNNKIIAYVNPDDLMDEDGNFFETAND